MNDQICLHGDALCCKVDCDTGNIVSIKIQGDALNTEFVANQTNLLYPQMKGNREWLGEWLSAFGIMKPSHGSPNVPVFLPAKLR